MITHYNAIVLNHNVIIIIILYFISFVHRNFTVNLSTDVSECDGNGDGHCSHLDALFDLASPPLVTTREKIDILHFFCSNKFCGFSSTHSVRFFFHFFSLEQ